ncbi:MAG: hypothetical protein DRJ08_06905 [Acidobacteria bacterium]|nr:MAG: hypothetical protein DRJ08_06905 [Acidobacteriota bacterium]
MSEKHTPLEEFEFRQAAKIRTPEEKRGKPTPQKKRLFLPILMIFLLAGTLYAAGFLYHQLLLEKKRTAELSNELTASRTEKTTAENNLKEIQQKLNKMTARLSTSSKGKGELLASLDRLKQDIDKKNQEISALKGNLRKFENRINKTEKLRKAVEKKLAKEQKTSQEIKAQLEAAQAGIRGYQDKALKLQRTIQTLQSNMNQEGNASRKLVSDMLEAQNEVASLRKEKKEMEKKIDLMKHEIASLKRVDPGDQVPFSDMVTPAKPIVHPAAVMEKKGVFKKVKGFILVNAYIDETGFVQNAFYLESHLRKDEKNGAAISQALKTVMRWRFSPALYNGKTPVKIWQPVAIPIQP